MSDLTERIALLMEEEGYSVEDTFLIDEMLLKTREVSRAKPLRRSDKENQISKCVLCGDDYRGWGNNPEPVKSFDDGQCCNSCNTMYVIPARLGFITDKKALQLDKNY